MEFHWAANIPAGNRAWEICSIVCSCGFAVPITTSELLLPGWQGFVIGGAAPIRFDQFPGLSDPDGVKALVEAVAARSV